MTLPDYTPPPALTVNQLILKLQQAVAENPSVGEFEAYAADDCSSNCDTPVCGILVEPGKRRLTVGE